MERKKIERIQHLLSFILLLSVFAFGCASTRFEFLVDHHLKGLKTCKIINVKQWEDTKLEIDKGDAILLVPLYPKGFIDSVTGKIGDSGERFNALDIDIGGIYKTNSTF